MKTRKYLSAMLVVLLVCTMLMPIEAQAQPWILISSCSVEGGGAVLGEESVLIIKLENKNKKAASNIKLSLVSTGEEKPAITLSSGVQSQYVGAIDAESEATVRLKFVPDASLESGKYPVTIRIQYQYDGMDYEVEDDIVIPITDKAEVSVTDIAISKAALMVTEEGTLTCSVNNTGNCSIYNVMVFAEGDCIDSASGYLGTIKQGESGSAEITVTGSEVTEDKTKIELVVQYETADKNSYEDREQVTVTVTEYTAGDYNSSLYSQLGQQEQSTANMLLALQIVLKMLAAIVIIVILGVIIYRRRKNTRG